MDGLFLKKKIGTKCDKNKMQGPKWESGQNIGTKSAFLLKRKKLRILVLGANDRRRKKIPKNEEERKCGRMEKKDYQQVSI